MYHPSSRSRKHKKKKSKKRKSSLASEDEAEEVWEEKKVAVPETATSKGDS